MESNVTATPRQPNSIPKIDIDKSRYDLDTYFGRVKHFAHMIDPRTIFVSDAQLDAAKVLISDYKNNTLTRPVTEDELWNAKKGEDYLSIFYSFFFELRHMTDTLSVTDSLHSA